MSFISVLPFGDTLDYWWYELDGDPRRLPFMAFKLLEISATMGNRLARVGHAASAAPDLTMVAPRAPNTVPDHPAVVVVVPVLCRDDDDARRIDALISSLAAQTYDCRPLLVDDGSHNWEPPSGIETIRLNDNYGPATARNRGLERAGEIGAQVVAFTDSDCVPDPDWVRTLVAAFHGNRHAHAISGATWSRDGGLLGRYQERNGTLNGRRLSGDDGLLYGPTCNLALCEELARSLRFDESFRDAAAEDIEFCFRAVLGGWSIRHAAKAVVHHDYGYDGAGPLGQLGRFWRQHRRYAAGERLLLRKHPGYVRAFASSVEIALEGASTPMSAWAESHETKTGAGNAPPGGNAKPPLSKQEAERLQRKMKRLEREDPNTYPLW